MKFALDVPNAGKYADPALLVDLAAESERHGWDGFFVWDHVVSGGRSPVADAWSVLAAIAVTTERIRFGPMVTPLARRRPWVVARQAVTVDQLSQGRFVLGVGSGQFSEKEFGAFGDEVDPQRRAEMLDEALEIIAGLWSGEPYSFAGQHYRVATTTFRPAPVQPRRIPIWVGGRWPNRAPMRRAARWDGAFAIPASRGLSDELTLEETAELIAFVDSCRTDVDDVDDFDVAHAGVLEGDGADAIGRAWEFAELGVTWWLGQVNASKMTPSKLRAFIRRGPPDRAST